MTSSDKLSLGILVLGMAVGLFGNMTAAFFWTLSSGCEEIHGVQSVVGIMSLVLFFACLFYVYHLFKQAT